MDVTFIPPKGSAQAAYAKGSQVSTVPSILHGLSGYNSGAAQFIQVHDAASVPDDGAVPKLNLKVDATANYSIDLGVYGMEFANGIYVCNSSTAETKTLGAADTQFFARWKTR